MDFQAKNFPANYSNEVLNVFEALSMTKLKDLQIVGSSSVRSQLYAGDFDAMEKVKDEGVAEKLKDIIKKLRSIPDCYINDIKIGEIPEWNVFRRSARIENGKVLDFNIKDSQSRVDQLRRDNIISAKEATEANQLLDKATTPMGFLEAKKEIRFHILRWKPNNILDGFLEYRGHKITLEDAIHSGGLIKIDIVYNNAGRFTDFSVIYNVYKGKKLITLPPPNIVASLLEDVTYYEETDPFKAIKRLFALAKATRSEDKAALLVPILNSDLGRLYQIINDLKVLLNLITINVPSIAEIKRQIDEIRSRMGNIYQLKDFLSNEHSIIGEINSLLKSPVASIQGKLERLINRLKVILDRDTRKELNKVLKKVK